MITFESQEAFEDAVMDALRQRLKVELRVDQVSDCDYYNPSKIPEVEIKLTDTLDIEPICQAEARAW